VLGKGVQAGFDIAGCDGLDDAFVVGPDLTQVGQVGVGIELDGLVGGPIGFEQAGDEGVAEPAEYREVEAPVLGMRDRDRAAVQPGPGLFDQVLKLADVLGGQGETASRQ
jgi:hypothetical protein